MPGGRPPKPVELKRLQGNPGKRSLPDARTTVALEPVTDVPPVPIGLEQAGRGLWMRLWTSPAQRWLSHEIDGPIGIEQLCYLADQVAELRRLVAEGGLALIEPIVTPAGHVVGDRIVANPLLKELRVAEKQFKDWASALGLDPTARSRLGLAEVKAASKLEDLMRRRNTGS